MEAMLLFRPNTRYDALDGIDDRQREASTSSPAFKHR